MTPRWWMCLMIGLAAPVVHGQTAPSYSQDSSQGYYDEDEYSEEEAGPLAPYAPPALPNETQTARPFRDAVWASGHWYWDGNEWRFNPGTWIASMPGYQFINGYWQQEGSGWRWISGGWARPGSTQVEIPIAVTNEEVVASQAPPAPQMETPPPAPAPSYTWAPGYWYWSGVNWSWVTGSWMAPPRPDLVFVTPRWVRRGPSWYFVGGGWAMHGSTRVVVPEYRYARISVGWGRPSYFVHTWRRYPMFHWSRPYGYRHGPRYNPPPYYRDRDWDRGPRHHDSGPNGPWRDRYDGPRRDHDGPRGRDHDGPRGRDHDGPRGRDHDGPRGRDNDGPRGGGWGRHDATPVRNR
ncbi:hypothetical protein CYFUS_003945 [Cystobacter fuscus]|uniref:Lipoprotein n=1 Tax=Cystobacter fuscus TaxID=43 RepID=A0A250J4P6_9BACT|nr:YXWGXW repeat-containing protein [Cystobacter fuscus]ATB38510.1 hypothetical protein CYFUS_003945 [Cystobacter fuscus]